MKKCFFYLCFCAFAFCSNTVYEEVTNDAAPDPIEDVSPPTANYSQALTKMILTFLALLILFGVSYWLMKRAGRNRMRNMNNLKAIKIRERRPISPKTTLYLIELSGKEILVAESQHEVRALSTFEWPDEEKSSKTERT